MRPRRGAQITDSGGLTDELLALRPRAVWDAFRSEHFAFIAISIYLVLEYVKPDQAYPIFGILPFVRLSLMAAIVGYVLDKQTKFAHSPLNTLLLVFLVHCVVSAIYAYDRDYSFEKLNVITLWVMIYFLITGIVSTERRLFIFVLAYFLANLKMSQFGFFSWVKRGFSFASWGVTGAGWFKNSGELGMEMTMFFAFTVCMALFLRKYWKGWVKWLMYFLPVSAIGCVLASSSRGAIVGCIAVVFYLSMFSNKRFRAWIGSAIFLALAYLVMPAQFMARFQTVGTDATSLSRISYWEKAQAMMDAHPYLGVGYYNWVPYYRDHYFDPTLYWRVEEAHNTFLQMGAELGYLGLGLFVIMVLCSFWINWRSERMCRREGFEFLRAFALGMNAAGMGMVFASLFLTSFFMPNYWIHFAFTVCLRTVVNRKLAQLEPDAHRAPSARVSRNGSARKRVAA
jgi:O-antigen ligase